MYKENRITEIIQQESRRRLSKNLLAYRRAHDIAREYLALECEITTAHLFSIEHGRTNASLDLLDKLSRGTGMTVAELMAE